jgi:DNA-binding PadR family transcriptional regulator
MSLIGETKLAILRKLQDGSSHGYVIAEAVNISSGGVYTHLDELEQEGMIEVVEVSEEGRGKKYYGLTEAGELLLRSFEKANN